MTLLPANFWTDFAEKLCNRRNLLFKHAPSCPRCHTRQIQSIDRKIFATWKCRHCHHYFMYEPIILEIV